MENDVTLTHSEWIVAQEYAKGSQDKEVADRLKKSIWTIKTQKKRIYQKLGISTGSELTLYVVCRYLGKTFDLKKIREIGLSVLFSLIFIVIQVTDNSSDFCRIRGSRCRTQVRVETRLKD